MKIFGILNVTPDSFYDGGKYSGLDHLLKRIETLIQDGADIIDIGAESSRPGAEEISVEEELRRLEPLLSHYHRYFDIPLSLDTRRARVAEVGIQSGVSFINDISGLKDDPEMAATIGKKPVTTILMHKQGSPKTMQNHPIYRDVVEEVYAALEESIAIAHQHGIEDLIVDPGIGFGKTLEHNLTLINRLDVFLRLNYPILIGTSNKSFIGKLTGDEVAERLEGTLASNVVGLTKGASYFRVHDVKACKKALAVAQAILNA